MVNVAGTEVALPNIDITGFLSSSWIYVFIISVFGLMVVIGIGVFLFMITYKKKIILFENVSGAGYQPIMRTRARIVPLGSSGGEVFKTLQGGHYLSAWGRKMGKNTYWYAKGPDGYWYNFLLGDLDTKMAVLDVEPVDRDVRMFHTAVDRLSHLTYGKVSFLEKYGVHMMLFLFLLVMIGGMWFIVGKVGDSTTALAATADTNREVAKTLQGILQGSSNIQNKIVSGVISNSSGLVPAT